MINYTEKNMINYTFKKSKNGPRILTFTKKTMKFFENHPCKKSVSYVLPILKSKLEKLGIEFRLTYDQIDFFESHLDSTSDFLKNSSFTERSLKNIVIDGLISSNLTIDECFDVLVYLWSKF